MTTHTEEATATLDCSGLLCPVPVYKAALALKELADGETLRLITTDLGALADIPALARQAGHRLVRSEESDGTQTFWLVKGGAA
jgi:tRNA 2-thiouridine synthesizing protein A